MRLDGESFREDRDCELGGQTGAEHFTGKCVLLNCHSGPSVHPTSLLSYNAVLCTLLRNEPLSMSIEGSHENLLLFVWCANSNGDQVCDCERGTITYEAAQSLQR